MKTTVTRLAVLLFAPLAALHAADLPTVQPPQYRAAGAKTNSIGMTLAPIQPGTFTMGQDGPPTDYKMSIHPAESDRADWDEKPAHRVVISKAPHIGTTKVTAEQYRQLDPHRTHF